MTWLKRISHQKFIVASFLITQFPSCSYTTFRAIALNVPCSTLSTTHFHSCTNSGIKMNTRSKTSPFFAKKKVVKEKSLPCGKFGKRGSTTQLRSKKVKREESSTQNVEAKAKNDPASKEGPSKKVKLQVERTQSFGAQWHGIFVPDTSVKVHTLLLGTHPSITSLSKVQYFGHPMNAFWWIAGDCMGFRRASAISPSTGKPYKLASSLYHGEDKVIPYEEQMKVFTSKGFALWDVIASCERPGSLDMDIKEEKPNKIREFCQDHPDIKRIIMVNGGKQCSFFSKYFEDWWLSGELKPGDNDLSRKAFRKFAKKTNNFENGTIECICLPSVSPAAASISYEDKREAYSKYCYTPGLLDHEELSK